MLNPREQLLLMAYLTLYINADKVGLYVPPAPMLSRAAVGLKLKAKYSGISHHSPRALEVMLEGLLVGGGWFLS